MFVFGFSERISTLGGPLGELVQWADLMAVLYKLGHDITLSWSAERLAEIVRPDWHGCKVGRIADIMYTDLHGFNQLQSSLNSVSKFKYRLGF